jgi:hypothetical protein
MNNNKKLIFIIIVALLVGLGCGILIDKYVINPKPTSTAIVIPDSLIKEENQKIDSLRRIEEEEKVKSEALMDSIMTIARLKYERVDSVKNLPTDSALNYLREILGKYEN